MREPSEIRATGSQSLYQKIEPDEPDDEDEETANERTKCPRGDEARRLSSPAGAAASVALGRGPPEKVIPTRRRTRRRASRPRTLNTRDLVPAIAKESIARA